MDSPSEYTTDIICSIGVQIKEIIRIQPVYKCPNDDVYTNCIVEKLFQQ